MKLVAAVSIIAVCLMAPRGASQGVKGNKLKVDMDHLDLHYGLKMKSMKLEKTSKSDTNITMIFEFARDIQSSSSSLRAAFAKDNSSPAMLQCYFFDESNVVFSKQAPGKTEGELTGKEGDAFRLIQKVPNTVLAKTKKIAFRFEFK